MSNNESVSIVENKIFNWGPCLFKSQVSEVIHSELLSRIFKASVPYNNNLASLIDNVQLLTKQDHAWLAKALTSIMQSYADEVTRRLGMDSSPFTTLRLQDTWVNFHRQHELNPEHTHGGDISFSIYLKIPELLKKENKAYTGANVGPGGVTFRYGEHNKLCINLNGFFPEERDIVIFPAYLSHWVIPFKSDCTRISIAGNFKCDWNY